MKVEKVDLERLLREERLRAIEEFERLLVRRGEIPDARKLLAHRCRKVLQYLGGLALAVFVSVVAILINFIVINMVMHI